MSTQPSPVSITIYAGSGPTPPGDHAIHESARAARSAIRSYFKPFIEVTGPPSNPGNPRTYPRNGGTLTWESEQGAVTHLLRILSTTDGSQVASVPLTNPTFNAATGEYSLHPVNVPAAATGNLYWFEVGLQITAAVTQEHRAHRFLVSITG